MQLVKLFKSEQSNESGELLQESNLAGFVELRTHMVGVAPDEILERVRSSDRPYCNEPDVGTAADR